MPDPAPSTPNALPPPFDRVGERTFSFYPPLVNIDHNEWLVREATWSEVLVVNAKSQEQIWLPRQYVGDLSRVDEPVMIVGLKRELEFKAGGVWPHVKRVIEMPRGMSTVPPASSEPATLPPGVSAVHGVASPNETSIGKLILISLLVGIGVVAVIVSFYRGRNSVESATYKGVMQTSLGFSPHDDYHAVARKFGAPSADRWKGNEGDLNFRILQYPARGFSVILMGRERDQARYIGAVDAEGHVIDSVEMPGGASTAAIVKQAAAKP
jgi:hypothetical protein